MTPYAGLAAKGELILDHVAMGEITPVEASSLMRAISSQARIIEVDENKNVIFEMILSSDGKAGTTYRAEKLKL